MILAMAAKTAEAASKNSVTTWLALSIHCGQQRIEPDKRSIKIVPLQDLRF
ncbi:MAG TPA: hypothetical protein ACFYEK_04645 [Candidatus Wunengus sp. YC60]|jgi:hypothetical protein|uniref:hypothetical protein n=1 Tax=Candidatus Wunengus sp. YC60 TaxID=3367697 RepID=UPI00402563B2